MRYERPAIERRVPISALLAEGKTSPGAGDDTFVQPIWRRGEKSED
jgi:hypothetical protein